MMKDGQAPRWKGRRAVTPFEYGDVELGKGRFKAQFNRMKQYFLSINNDAILKGFRERAGLRAPGNGLEGWYAQSGHLFGQWLSALARMYRTTRKAPIANKLDLLLGEWGKTIGIDGCFLYRRNTLVSQYVFDKIVGGLVDIYEYVGEEIAINYLSRVTDWGAKNLNRRRIPATPDFPSGGSGLGHGRGSDREWYTLPENLYRAYILTGDSKYRNFARIWHYENYWATLANAKDCMTGLHAYSHVNALNSAAMAYAVSGNPSYLDTVVNAYEILHKTQLFATGGYGPGEKLASPYGSLGDSLYLQENTFEVPCGSWAAFKLARYLIIFTGRAFYGDWMEKLLYNAIGAALPMGEGGKTFYYSDYRRGGGEKKYYPQVWPCCAGTYPLAVTDYHNIIYFKDRESIYVNMYLPSRVRWSCPGQTVNLTQETDFPTTGKVSLKVEMSIPAVFSLNFRIPLWVRQSISVRINDVSLQGEWKPGDWGKIKRLWNSGDVVTIRFPLELYFIRVDRYHPDLLALMYGPVVLAADRAGPLSGALEHPSSWIFPTSDKELEFLVRKGNKERQFRAYYAYGEKEPYYIYNSIEE